MIHVEIAITQLAHYTSTCLHLWRKEQVWDCYRAHMHRMSCMDMPTVHQRKGKSQETRPCISQLLVFFRIIHHQCIGHLHFHSRWPN